MLDNADPIRLKAKFFHGLADATRLTILETLLDGEKNVNEIVALLQVSQPKVSAHLACLRECGLVKSKERGKFTYYTLYDEKIRDVLREAEEILAQVTHDIYACTHLRELRPKGASRTRVSYLLRRAIQTPPTKSRK